MKQLALPFGDTASFTADDFCAAPSNAAALRWLERTESWPERRLILWGAPGSGKTHLVHVWAASRGAAVLNGAARLPAMPPGPLAVDDADLATDETGLLHLLNNAAAPVLLTAATPPARQEILLPDLASRLRAATAVEIGPAEDELLAALLARLEAERQLRLTPALRNHLLTRLPRSAQALREAVARLDRAGLDRGRPIPATAAAVLLADIEEVL